MSARRTWVRAGLLAGLAWAGAARAQLPEEAIAERFEAAQAAFDAGRFDEAAEAYASLAADGVRSSEVQYNLGNALYRSGRRGEAVLAWRRAWRNAPRDPDVRANLRFAMNEGDAVMSTASPVSQVIEVLPLSRWATLAAAAWWAFWLLAAAAAASTRFRPALHLLTPPLAAVFAAAAFAVYHWTRGHGDREWVVTTESGTRALYAPLEDADPHYELPAGSIVELKERSGSWLKIAIDGREGWILDADATPVAADG